MRLLIYAALFCCAAAAAEDRIPIVVELFTSEGCSSCPPADELVAKLEREQPLSNVQIIALEEHVDYWNNADWTDPFSSPSFRGRQDQYARVFHTENIYTPQIVINGRKQLTGDDAAKAMAEMRRLAASWNPIRVDLAATPDPRESNVLHLAAVVQPLRSAKNACDCDVYLAVTESNLRTRVLGGENSGRRLQHGPVVRSFDLIGRTTSDKYGEYQLLPQLKFPPAWRRENLRLTVFVQDRGSGAILGAETLPVR